jgi:hypothetical protein
MCRKDKGLCEPKVAPDVKIGHSPVAVFIVNPSGGDDTRALTDAFEDAKAAGPGSQVKLVQGEYHIGMIEVHNFNGCFTGAGKGKTIVFPLTDLGCRDIYNQNLSIGLIKFFGGKISVSQMSFRNSGDQPCHCEDYSNHGFAEELWYYLGFLDYAINEHISPNHYIRARVEGVEFTGSAGGPLGYKIYMAVMCSGDFVEGSDLPYSNADISITNCSFNNFYNAFQNLGMGTGSFVFSDNTVSNTFFALWLQDNIGGNSLISGNRFNISPSGTGIGINNYIWGFNELKLGNGCQYVVTENEFLTENSWTAIDIFDKRKFQGISDINNSLLLLVKNNLFDLRGTASTGIWNFYSAEAIIRNNKFIGQATNAGLFSFAADKTEIHGNDFSNMIDTEYNIVMLGNNNTVIGDKSNGTILNLGENNMISGFTLMQGENPVGQSINIDKYWIMQEDMFKMRRQQ